MPWRTSTCSASGEARRAVDAAVHALLFLGHKAPKASCSVFRRREPGFELSKPGFGAESGGPFGVSVLHGGVSLFLGCSSLLLGDDVAA